MRKFHLPGLLIVILSLIYVPATHGQTTTLVTREKGKNISSVSISLCDKSGAKTITPDAFRASDWIYFLVEPKEGYSKPVFRESEIKEELPKIVLWQPQPGKYLTPVVNPLLQDKRITSVILAFPKNETRAHLPFTFAKDGTSSEELLLDETYYDQYPQFKSALDEAQRLLGAGNWLEAYYSITGFLRKDGVAENLRYFSFAKKLTDELPLQALTKGADEAKAALLKKFEAFSENPSKSGLDALQEAAGEVDRYLRLTAAYKDMGYEASQSFAALSAALDKLTKEKTAEAETQYINSRFAMLMGQSYHDQRFSTFLDLVYRAVLQSFGTPVAGVKALNPLLSSGKREELRRLGWFNDLQELFYAVEKHTAATDAPVPPSVLKHLENLRATQPKPYYEILLLASDNKADKDNRLDLLQTAINTCPAENEMAMMELWKAILAGDMKTSQIPTSLTDGIKQLDARNLGSAAELFDQALRLRPDDAFAWYYRAMAHYKAGEIFAAEAKTDRALEINPEMTSAVLLKISIWHDTKNTEALGQIFSRPVSKGPNFLFDMAKANFLIEQNKAAEAVKLLENGPIIMCPGSTAPYYLLGDAYAALKQPDKARQAYLKTQQIDPFDSAVFEEKMRALERK